MQLNMGALRLNTLFFTSFSIIFIFTSFSFSSISLPSGIYISSFSILSFSIFSFNVCWSFLACLGVINFNFISCPSCLKQRERLSRLRVLKGSNAHLKEDDKSSWEQYHIILLSHMVLYRIWSFLDSDESLLVTGVSPPIFGLQYCCRFGKRMQLDMGGLRLNTFFSTTFSIIFFLYFLFFFINFPSFCSLYFFFFNSFFVS